MSIENLRIWRAALLTMPRMSDQDWGNLDWFGRWLVAVRASVLLMTLSSSIFAGLLAQYFGNFRGGIWLLVTLGLLLAHATNNLINDLTDHWRGVDEDQYLRNQYGVQPLSRGLLTVWNMLLLIALTGGLALSIGLYLVATEGQSIIYMVLAGAFFVLFYTWPLKKWGLGEPAVLLVWGPLMVGGCYYVINGSWDWMVALVSIPYALGPTSVLFGKHLDKRVSDETKGVRTLPVQLGDERSRYTVLAMLLVQYGLLMLLVLLGYLPWTVLAVLLGMKSAVRMWRVYSQKAPEAKPDFFPASIWPLWFSAYAFAHTRVYGALLLLGFFVAVICNL